MKFKRLLSSVLLLSLLLVGCTGDGNADDTNRTVDTTPEETDESDLVHAIPSDLKFTGSPFRILSSGGGYMADKWEIYEEGKMDVLLQATYDRLIKTEEKFGVEIEVIYSGIDTADDDVRMSVTSMSDDYDFVVACSNYIQNSIYEGLYIPVSDLPYVDLDMPWWNKGYIESVSIIPDEPYLLFGPINYNSIQRSVCTAFNNDILEKTQHLTPEDMYQMVLDGEWTYDKFAELCKNVYMDENGNTIQDIDDTYAFMHCGYWQVDFMAFGAGLSFTERDDDGYPVLALNNERSIQLAEKLLTIFNNKSEIYNAKGGSGEGFTMFGEGKTMFYIERFLALEKDIIRGSDVEYGIIPVPKLDETIDNYYSPVERLVQWGLVPVTVKDPEMISAVLEYMAYDGYKNVMPAYYDITLKLKYTRGDDLDTASQMLDIITENQYTDFLGANELGGLEKIFTKVVVSGQNTFASNYASLEGVANANIQNFISALKG